MTTANTTTLARRYGVTTKALEKRLQRLGIVPIQELVQPNGRRFVIWPEEACIEALDRYKLEKLEGRPKRPLKVESQAADELRAEIQEIKEMVQTLLNLFTQGRPMALPQQQPKPF